MSQSYSLVWDLDAFFPGGSSSAEFALFLQQLERAVEQFRGEVRTATDAGTAVDAQTLADLTERMQNVTLMLREADSFAGCLAAENQHDKKAVQLGGHISSIGASFTSALTRFDQLLRQIPDGIWTELLQSAGFSPIAFPLAERRHLAKEKLPPEQESLIADLAVDGYHGWEEAYNTTVGKFKIAFEENGQTLELSAGQAANKLNSTDRNVRTRLFADWEKAWGESADFAADALNRLAGFRLQVYKHRGWESVLKEPLAINRMSEQTLQVMWDVIDRNKGPFVDYLRRKANMFGLEALSWHDVDASVGKAAKEIPFEEAANMIVSQFRRFSPKMADFAEMAFANRWIEAEDRPGKRPGGFCTSFPIKGETRIFMTYGKTASNVATLAHELGHAYHQHVMNDMPALAQEYAMNVAETASTFAEMIVADAAVKMASSEEERLTLIEDKIQRSVAFFMNIHARFLFETEFYELRRKGLVGTEQLCELMQNAQRRAYKDALSEYHPHFWASKLHFYITGVPFYNFPYTFGYLFSSGIYAVALREGAAFEDKYIALLRDTGSMTVEQLAEKHLGVDLTKPDFWQSAVDLAMEDVKQFMAMTE
ncbi:M3 family oligoendopeptidase [Paenibacillus ginsengarvi]|uniref:M3 family oligoendopeptidase n=1 Tax=Paenibacillus ginsengarvi TaxID=400777 RepID=A0A3B0AZT2_9BACL|nr:M3 family oligoendopeptidase [Paenibacillus ginsengarvi]RKN65437.1 M3 family oligoendopeptidase [Paenibacillus ginsengarvi]